MTKLEVHKLAWHSLLSYKTALTASRNIYFSSVINLNKNNPKFLFDTVKTYKKQPQKVGSSLSASNFLDLFKHKIESIRKEIDASPTLLLDHPTRHTSPPEATFL